MFASEDGGDRWLWRVPPDGLKATRRMTEKCGVVDATLVDFVPNSDNRVLGGWISAGIREKGVTEARREIEEVRQVVAIQHVPRTGPKPVQGSRQGSYDSMVKDIECAVEVLELGWKER